MKLLVGLGNPGPEYNATRHNTGFQAVDAIAHRYAFRGWRQSCKGEIARGIIAREKVIALKPRTFMNLSGESVLAAMSFFKIQPKDVIVFHDELALPVGKVRVKVGGSSAGHNGIKSIDSQIGPDYMRVRIGVDQDPTVETKDYVLAIPSDQDQQALTAIIKKIADYMPVLLRGDADSFMNRLVG